MSVHVRKESGYLSVTLDSPHTSNALSPAMVEAVIAAFSATDDVRLCTIQGSGRHFCAGFDLSEIDALSDGDLLYRFLRIETMLQMVHHASFPVMALCQGHVIGAGADLVAACWQRVADPSAKFKMPGWNFELALGTRRLTRLVGSQIARDMLMDTRTVLAHEAREIGLVSQVSDRELWADMIETLQKRSAILPDFAQASMFDLTLPDTRAADIAAIVHTAGRPSLKKRIKAYGATVAAARTQRKASK